MYPIFVLDLKPGRGGRGGAMSWRVSKARQAAACGLLALFGAAFAVRAEDRSVRPAPARYRIFMNATVVAADAEAGTLTVNGGAIGREQTFTVAAEARRDARGLEPGDEVVIALGAADTGEETVMRVVRSAANRPSPGSTAQPDSPSTPAPSLQPTPSPSPRPTPAASAPSGERALPTDVVGPFRDPRVNPNFDPRVNPHRDPRVIPGLTAPAPTPAPTPSPEKGR
jgi:hypothetical protein